MFSSFSESAQYRINICCRVALLLLCFFLLMYYSGMIQPEQLFPPCIFYAKTGFFCPACGGTRAFLYLIHGQILMSLSYHVLPDYGAFLIMAGTINSFLKKPIFLFHPLHFVMIPPLMLLNAILHNLSILFCF